MERIVIVAFRYLSYAKAMLEKCIFVCERLIATRAAKTHNIQCCCHQIVQIALKGSDSKNNYIDMNVGV